MNNKALNDIAFLTTCIFNECEDLEKLDNNIAAAFPQYLTSLGALTTLETLREARNIRGGGFGNSNILTYYKADFCIWLFTGDYDTRLKKFDKFIDICKHYAELYPSKIRTVEEYERLLNMDPFDQDAYYYFEELGERDLDKHAIIFNLYCDSLFN